MYSKLQPTTANGDVMKEPMKKQLMKQPNKNVRLFGAHFGLNFMPWIKQHTSKYT